MELNTVKHYIKTDANGLIVDGYSTAFRVPQPEDTLINADGGRKFQINGKPNPVLKNSQGLPLYRWTGTEVVETDPPEDHPYYNWGGTKWKEDKIKKDKGEAKQALQQFSGQLPLELIISLIDLLEQKGVISKNELPSEEKLKFGQAKLAKIKSKD